MVTVKRLNTKTMFNLANYKKALNKQIPKMINNSAGIVIMDIKSGINYGRDIDGKPMKPLSEFTILEKRKHGSKTPRVALSDTGTMKKTYIKKRATASNPSAHISVAQKRLDPENIAKRHQLGTGVPQRKWFGISKTAHKRIKRLFELSLAKELKRNWGM